MLSSPWPAPPAFGCALAWGAFPFVTAYWASAETFAPSAVAGVATCFALSLAQRPLSRQVRTIRRRVRVLEGTITYTDGGQRSQIKRVYNYATFGCAKYAPLTGGYFLTGNCYEFTNIPKSQTVYIKVRYQEGLIRYKSDWFSWWESFNWMGVIKNW